MYRYSFSHFNKFYLFWIICIPLIAGSSPYSIEHVNNGPDFHYDTTGNRLTDGRDQAIAFNLLGKPVTIMNGGQHEIFRYGTFGHRYLRKNAGGTTLYLAGGTVEFIIDPDGNTKNIVYIHHKDYSPLAQVSTTSTTDPAYTYYLRDSLGSPILTVDNTGNASPGQRYDAWGKSVAAQGESTASESMHPGFTGHETIDSDGLIHMNARVYDSHIGQFISPDSILQHPRKLQNLNRYSYVLNSPLNGIDPTGHTMIRPRAASTVRTQQWKSALGYLMDHSKFFANMFQDLDNSPAKVITEFHSGAEGHSFKILPIPTADNPQFLHAQANWNPYYIAATLRGGVRGHEMPLAHEYIHALQLLLMHNESIGTEEVEMFKATHLGEVETHLTPSIKQHPVDFQAFQDMSVQDLLIQPADTRLERAIRRALVEENAVVKENIIAREIDYPELSTREYYGDASDPFRVFDAKFDSPLEERLAHFNNERTKWLNRQTE